MKGDRLATNRELWSTAYPLLPEKIQSLSISKCVIKFRLTAHAGTKATVHVDHTEGEGYNMRSRKAQADILDPYKLYDALKQRVSNWPTHATSLDLTIDPNGTSKIKTMYVPVLREEQ